MRQWIEVADGHPGNTDALAYDTLVATGNGAPLEIERSPDDLLLLYTGGTTGMPKGVMWRHQDLWCVTGAGGNPRLGLGPSPDLQSYIERIRAEPPPVTPRAAAPSGHARQERRHRRPTDAEGAD